LFLEELGKDYFVIFFGILPVGDLGKKAD